MEYNERMLYLIVEFFDAVVFSKIHSGTALFCIFRRIISFSLPCDFALRAFNASLTKFSREMHSSLFQL